VWTVNFFANQSVVRVALQLYQLATAFAFDFDLAVDNNAFK
jgi:hypothetical protein